jgi:hypothetical protein
MSDQASGDPTAERREAFEQQLAEVRIKSGTAEADRRGTVTGLVLAVSGVVLVAVAYALSTGQDDSRDVISSVILGLLGVSLTTLGSVVFLRYSFATYLRAWLLRLIYEEQVRD